MELHRRNLLRLGIASTASLALFGGTLPAQGADAPSGASPTPDEALKRLMDGNARFVSQQMTRPNQTNARRTALAAGQSPYAIILGCADSRVPPELVFDEGLGDLFVVRVAGNAPNPQLIASIEYGVGVLNAPLVMVLGHSSCGAVAAAVKSIVNGTPLPTGHLQSLIDELSPAVTQIQAEPGDLTANATTRNVQLAVQALAGQDPLLASAVAQGSLKVVGAQYDLASGSVTLVPALS
jgi:carbonic anhydrase